MGSKQTRCVGCGTLLFRRVGDTIEWPDEIRLLFIADAPARRYEVICPDCLRSEACPLDMTGHSLGKKAQTGDLVLIDGFSACADGIKFEEATKICLLYRDLRHKLILPALIPIATAFIANIDRILAVVEFAALSTGLSYLHVTYSQRLGLAVSGKSNDFSLKVYQDSVELYRSPIPDTLRIRAINRGHSELLKWSQKHSEMVPGIKAVLSAQVIGAWTAFETLAGDLWAESMLLKPTPLAVVSFAKIFPPDREQVEKKVRQYMRRLEGIQSRYRESFGETESDSVFSGEDFSALWVLEGVRNVLVHKGGIVDDMFILRRGEHPQEYKRFGLHTLTHGDLLEVNGRLVADLVNPAVSFSSTLLSFVDSWFANHP